jgi:hypothetical protein
MDGPILSNHNLPLLVKQLLLLALHYSTKCAAVGE